MSQDGGLLTISQAELARVLEEVGGAGGCLRFQAHGRSMWPFVRSGDTLLVEPLGDRSVKVGDVLLYRTPGRGVAVHRVTGSRGETLRIRGDRLLAPLELVEPKDVLARVLAVEWCGRVRPSALLRVLALAWIAVRPVVRACWNRLSLSLAAVKGRGRGSRLSGRHSPD